MEMRLSLKGSNNKDFSAFSFQQKLLFSTFDVAATVQQLPEDWIACKPVSEIWNCNVHGSLLLCLKVNVE